jgi:thiol-disulfide isomerase/thioredoxin
VLQAPGKVVVDFYGDGCVPCAALMPHVHEFAEKYGSEAEVLRPEHDEGPAAGHRPEDPGPAGDRGV